jgi:hypothetical protein
MYTPEHIRAAAERTFDFFTAHPEKRVTCTLAIDANKESVSPFDGAADCFCFVGRFARELGPLTNSDPCFYEAGYTEVREAVGGIRIADDMWAINDSHIVDDTPEVLKLERQLLRQVGVLD